MPYQSYFPNSYQPAYQQNQYQQNQNYQQYQNNQYQNQQSQQTLQNGGFVLVPNEDVALNWPVAPGNCVTFKIQNEPLVIEKSMGFSQLENPKIERYKLIKEESEDAIKSLPQYALQEDYMSLKSELSSLREDMDDFINRIKEPVRRTRKKEVEDDA